MLTEEQQKVLDFDKQRLIISASAGSGKTFVLIKYISNLILTKKVPLRRFLVLTFTKAAANEMKQRLQTAFLAEKPSPFLSQQIDEISSSDISTIDAFCEKVIKQNLSKTYLDENFSVVDERQSVLLMQRAFDRTVEEFSITNANEFSQIFFAFKKMKDNIFACMQYLLSYFDSQDDEEYFIDYILNNSEKLFSEACSALNQNLKESFISLSQQLFTFNSTEPQLVTYFDFLQNVLKSPLSDDFIENAKTLSGITFPRLPGKTADVAGKALLKAVGDGLKKLIFSLSQYDFSPLSLQKQKLNTLGNAILKFYQNFKQNYVKIKQNQDVIDFADAEKITKSLLEDDEVLTALQESYDYIFIDEYQDTNALQESIIKPIAQKGMFVAVGDIKQGIYGFRNASMDIMLQDIADFSADENSEALFLKSNFRSDKKILDFVNFIFEKVMTKNSSGVDYKETSMFKGEKDFKFDGQEAVQALICQEEQDDLEETLEVYDITKDPLTNKSSGKVEARAIVKKVKEFLASKIYNPQNYSFEEVRPQDIAILFRNRNNVMQECYRLLSQNGISAITDSKNSLFENSAVKVLCALIKLAISSKDDIALATVMHSPFGDFSLDELASISLSGEGKFYEKTEKLRQNNQKIEKFYQFLSDFAFNCGLYGIIKTLKQKLSQTHFFEKFSSNTLEDKQSVEQFYSFISSINADFNLQAVIEGFENLNVKSAQVSQTENSVLLTTIHATKGLEYPIVILAGCGDNFDRTNTNPYAISKRFGFGTNVYDDVTLTKSTTPVLRAIKLEAKKKSFVDELMIFYVALTRAKNHLVLCGTQANLLAKTKPEECSTYFDFLLFSLGCGGVERLVTDGVLQTANFSVKIVEGEQEEETLAQKENLIDFDEEKVRKLLKNQTYSGLNEIVELKRSVTLLANEEKDFLSEANFSERGKVLREESILQGDAVHLALEKLDFEKINSLIDLEKELEQDEELSKSLSFIDKDVLFQNIMLIKSVSGKGQIYKEKQFVMSLPLEQSDEEIVVQGAIDFCSVSEKEVVLIDYKYSSQKNEEILKKRYKAQLDLYEKALIKAFPNKTIKKYLLSLKYAKIIEF